MDIKPNREEFAQLVNSGYNLVPVYAEVMGDMDTPISTFLKLKPSPYSFLLESVEGGEKWGRYSFMSNSPSLVFKSKGQDVEILNPDGSILSKEEVDDPLDSLKKILSKYKPAPVAGLPRFY